MTPLGALGRGLVAGAIGTAVMTGYQMLVARIRESADDEEESTSAAQEPPADPWEEAPAPAQVARRVIEGLTGREVPASRIGLLTNVTHWTYGIAWGGLAGILLGSTGTARPVREGLALGSAVWGTSYATLVPIGIYEPPWEYPPAELAIDFSYHAVYGAGVAGAFRLLERLP